VGSSRAWATSWVPERSTVELARRYDLEDAGEAQRAVMEDSFMGKLVIEP